MYHFGLFVGGRDLHPIPRGILKEGAPKLKALYSEGLACAVFVLGDGEWDADAAMYFGVPVNLVVTTDQFPGVSFLLENAYDVYGASCQIFALPYVDRDLLNVLDEADLMTFDTAPDWMKYTTEADAIVVDRLITQTQRR